MACCKCCCGNADCEEGDEGKCCCGGSSGECCDVGEYCCSGVCEPDPCGGTCCFKDAVGSYSFTFKTYSGSFSMGYWSGSGSEYMMIMCTPGVNLCSPSTPCDGLSITFYDGTSYWSGRECGSWDSHDCNSVASLAGTYTLTDCNGNTDTLTIT